MGEPVIIHKYRLEQRISFGSFGVIYRGRDISTGQQVAVKLESIYAQVPQLAYEYKLYMHLHNNPNNEHAIGFPKVYWYGQQGSVHALAMDLLSVSLEDMFNIMNRKFSLKTVLLLADQMISRIQYVHEKDYIYRDSKPDNFLLDLSNNSNTLYLVDFGLAKRYRHAQTKKHVPFQQFRNLTGTARYASASSHIGIEQSRRDDLEAIGFILIYFLIGKLPWQGLRGSTKKEKYELITMKKMNTTIERLCENLPEEFAVYLHYCRELHYSETPDYDLLRNLFRNLYVKMGYKFDNQYDWSILASNSPLQLLLESSSNCIVPEQPLKSSDDESTIITTSQCNHPNVLCEDYTNIDIPIDRLVITNQQQHDQWEYEKKNDTPYHDDGNDPKNATSSPEPQTIDSTCRSPE